ncbi:hypothetical protein A2W14_07020 [Candidatus Gottesmanbacteria bacterium RBG_16_37_8]|uniref:Uncharacterized protein n=1 Tax=Candidatus Gottesmanbacteria bacterium RBG_16_37_8 TaxID=1798371 RepID=A0A1F5YT18_9BACT|nr:MAG: hypothetical protein A2W14_07020 [Candidatus Gottesmanbacteria bacterium RBG_16_37_8]
MDNQIITILTKIRKDLTEVKKKLEDLEPVYGSNIWWDWSDHRAIKDYQEGNYKKVSSKNKLKKLLQSFKS